MLRAWIRKKYLLVLCFTGIHLYPVLGLAQQPPSFLRNMTTSQALEYAMTYYFSLRSEVLMEQSTPPLFAPQLPFHRFYERGFSLMAIPIDQSREAFLAFEQLRSRDDWSEATLISAARASGKIALYRFQTDEPRIIALLEPHLESQNPLQSLSDSQLADHIDWQYNGAPFDRHRGFTMIFQAWIRDMSSLNTPQGTPDNLRPTQLPDELHRPLYQIIVAESPRVLKQDIGLLFSIKKEILERLSQRSYSPEFINEVSRILFLPHGFFRQAAVVLRIPSGMWPGELSNEQLGQTLALYSAINLNDLSVRNEPFLREASQRLSGRGYSLTVDDLNSLFLVTNDAPARITMVLNTPDGPIEALSNEDLAKRIDFYPHGPASLLLRLSTDQHIKEGLKRVEQFYSPEALELINDAPTLSRVLRLLDQSMGVSLLPHYDIGSIFLNTTHEQLQRIEALVNIEDGHWSLDFYRQHLPEDHQLSGMDLIEQFSRDVQTARTFVAASRRLESEDVKELSDKGLANRIILSSPSVLPSNTDRQNDQALFYPLSGLPTRLTGLDRYIEEGLKRVSEYYSEGVRQHIDNAFILSKVLILLDHNKNQRVQLQQLSDRELGDRINALSDLQPEHIKRLRRLLVPQQHMIDSSWPLTFYIRQFSENQRLSGMDLIEQFDRDIQRATLLNEGLNRLLLSLPDDAPPSNNPYQVTTVAQNLTRLHFLVNDLGFDRAFAANILHEIYHRLGTIRFGENLISVEIDAQMSGEKPKSAINIESLWLDYQLTHAMATDTGFSSQVNAITEGREPNVVIKQKLITLVLSSLVDHNLEGSRFASEYPSYRIRALEETEFIKSRFPLPPALCDGSVMDQ